LFRWFSEIPKRLSTRYIKSEIRDYFNRETSGAGIPPVPVPLNMVLSPGNGKHPERGSAAPSGSGFFLFRAAAAALIFACLAALQLIPVRHNELAKIANIDPEREVLDEIVISSLQKAGRFLDENL